MKKFMVLYMMPTETMKEAMQNSTPESREKDMQEWKEWMDAHKADLADMGSPLGKNMRVTKDGGELTSNEIGGYSIMQGESLEAVAEILKDNPSFRHMPTSYIEIMEIASM